MTRNIWLFGDSFAADDQHSHIDWCYYNLLKNQLSSNLYNFGNGSTSLGYTYHQFNENRSRIKENDVLIICLTDLYRKYFFLDRPKASGIHMQLTYSLCYDYEIHAIEQYYKYLHLEEDARANIKNFLYNVELITQQLKLSTIIMSLGPLRALDVTPDNFPSLKFGEKPLSLISGDESHDDSILKFVSGRLDGYFDPRLNHLCASNHKVLAKKIFDAIDLGKTLDLFDGFHKNIITIDSLNSIEFRQTELKPGFQVKDIPEILRR